MAEKVNIKKLAVGRKNIYLLDPKDIYIDPAWNERNMSNPKVVDHIEGLALSISKVGVKDPLTVVGIDDKVHLTDGYCRMAAIQLAAVKYDTVIEAVKVIVEERGSNEADHIASMLTRNDGLKFTFAEQARVVKRLLALGLNNKEIAETTGKSITHIDNCLLLLEGDVKIMKYVDTGTVSARLALEMLRKKGAKALEAIDKAISQTKAAGKGKATQRTARPDAGLSAPLKKTNWQKHGPECGSLLDQLEDWYDKQTDCPDDIADIVNYWKNYKAAEKLKIAPVNGG